MERDVKKKICLLGAPSVGKTSLVRRYVLDLFDDRYITTVGSKVVKKRIRQMSATGIERDLTMMIWDISGQDAMASIKAMYYKGANAAIIVCDLTRADTLAASEKRANDIFRVTGKIPLIMLGNKCDLPERGFDLEELEALAARFEAPVFLTSAKNGDNVEEAFRKMGELVIG